MLRLLKKTKGFTLVELMIVIAIIGILMVVLIPKVGQMKENAKVLGVEANIQSVGSQVQLMIDDYKPDADGIENFKNDLIARLGSNIKNPFNNNTNVIPWDEVNRAAVKIYTISTPGNSNQIQSDNEFALGSNSINRANGDGMVVVSIYITQSNLLEASIYGFKQDTDLFTTGDPITTEVKVLRVSQ